MKTVLITGSSSGIGYAAALAFAKIGHQVIATMRDLNKQKKLQDEMLQEKLTIDIRQLDVTNELSVQTVIEDVLRDYGHIDILINNAGSGFLGTLEQTSLAQAKEVMDVNFFGVWNVTKAVLPSMRQRRAGHIISITSVGGVVAQPFNDAYCAAKFAVEGMMESLALATKSFGVQISLVEPGAVRSEFVDSVREKSPVLSTELESDYKPILDSYLKLAAYAYAELSQAPEQVAEVLVKIAEGKKEQLRYQTSETSKKIVAQKLGLCGEPA